MRGIAAERPPLRLHVGLGEPLDVLQRRVLLVGIGDDRDALAAEVEPRLFCGRVDEEADLVAADVFGSVYRPGKKANQFIAIATWPDLKASRLSPM